jgi:hypothetical protein
VALGGCVPRTLDTTQLERRIGRQLSEQLNVDGIRVTCPRGVEVAEGDRFTCSAATGDGDDAIRIVVTQIDDEGDVSWEIAGTAE